VKDVDILYVKIFPTIFLPALLVYLWMLHQKLGMLLSVICVFCY